VNDGSEDTNLNGRVDAGETDPSLGHGGDDQASDQDGDGLSDDLEEFLHSDPNDADSDDDGVPDGDEANPAEDTDGDGLINILDVDSDNDALYDGTEMGRSCTGAGTDASAGHCRADLDAGATKTSPLLWDTDGGGASDGSEDWNRNGVVDSGETDPTAGHGADDATVQDQDGDGLGDALEGTLGTDPEDADSDDDGVRDGEEANPGDDHDGDGTIDALDSDSDNDGLFDGTELGKGCDDPDTDASANQCVADADAGATTTSPINDDTDFGGKRDGDEDVNKNGQIDDGELDPNDARDDKVGDACTMDTECGANDSGVVCDDDVCTFGCRGQDGNGCPDGAMCSSTTSDIGMCQDGAADGGMPDGGVVGVGDGGVSSATGRLGGGGCDCRAAHGESQQSPLSWLWLAPLAWLMRRRGRKRA
jgi:clumping factor A